MSCVPAFVQTEVSTNNTAPAARHLFETATAMWFGPNDRILVIDNRRNVPPLPVRTFARHSL